jgi:anti-sigma factor RsiW
VTDDGRDLACNELVELVTDYLEEALPEPERGRFEAHLATCEGCANYLAQMKATIRITGTLREDGVPPPVMDRLLEAFRGYRA